MTRPRAMPYAFNHPLFTVWGVRGATLAPDAMHTVDGGVSSHVLGNVFYELTYEQIGGPPQDAVGALWRQIKQLYNDLGTRGGAGRDERGQLGPEEEERADGDGEPSLPPLFLSLSRPLGEPERGGEGLRSRVLPFW